LLIKSDGSVEVIGFAEVSDDGNGRYTLSTLLRGLRGTEGEVAGHAIGDVFVLLQDDTVNRLLLPLDELDEVLFYRAVGRGEALRDATTLPITPAGRDLMPFAPVQHAASGSWGSDVTLTWERRTRIGGELVDGTGDVPLGEDSEAYELEILDGPDGEVLRTATGLTARSFTYSAAMQSADFGSVQTELTFVVYQISVQVGRGFPGEAAVEIVP
jgi:hypothetical protein